LPNEKETSPKLNPLQDVLKLHQGYMPWCKKRSSMMQEVLEESKEEDIEIKITDEEVKLE
jgi:hypothetical protein